MQKTRPDSFLFRRTSVIGEKIVNGFRMNSEPLKKYIRDHNPLFWWIKEEAKEDLSVQMVVETILNYGHISDIQELFDLIGMERVSQIFHEQISRKRINYHPRTVNFFKFNFD